MIDYILLSAGISFMDQPLDRPWWWQQPGYAHTQYERSNTFGIGLGVQILPRTRMELAYRDLGRYSGFVSWQEPEKTQCNGPCSKTYWGFNTGTVRGIDIAAIRDFRYVSLGGGAFVYRSEWRHYRNDPDNPYSRAYGDGSVRSVQYGITPTVSLRVPVGGLEVGLVSYFEVPSDDVCCSPWRSAYALTLTSKTKP